MYISSALFSFLEAALKRRPRAIEAETKQLMSARLKTHLAVHGGGRTMVERNWLFGKRIINFEFTVMREPDYKE